MLRVGYSGRQAIRNVRVIYRARLSIFLRMHANIYMIYIYMSPRRRTHIPVQLAEAPEGLTSRL